MTMTIAQRNASIVKDFAKGGVTKAALARKYGVDEKTIRRVLKAEGTPSTSQVKAAAPKVTAKSKLKAKAKSLTSAPKSAKAASKTSAPAGKEPAPVATGVRAALEAGKEVQYIITGDSIILSLGDDSEIVDSTHANFKAVRDAVLAGQFAEAFKLMNIAKAITAFTKGAITVKGDHLYYGELEMRSTLVTRILDLMSQGDEAFKPLVAFFERLLNNPSSDSVDQLWGFVSHLDVEIDPEGYIIGWKKVRSQSGHLFDSHTGKVPNDVGNIVEMPRFMVNSNRHQTCSQGLHVGAWDYVKGFSGDTILKVKVDPADVVSVPNDYNDMKMRAAKYEVLGVVNGLRQPTDFKRAADVKRLHVKVGQRGEILDSKEI